MPEHDAKHVDGSEDEKIVLHAAVRTEKDEQPQARTCERPCHERPCAHSALRVKLRKCNRNGAVRQHASQPGQKLADNRLVEDEALQHIIPREVQRQLQDTGDDKDKQEYLRRVDEGGNDDTMMFGAPAPAVRTKIANMR